MAINVESYFIYWFTEIIFYVLNQLCNIKAILIDRIGMQYAQDGRGHELYMCEVGTCHGVMRHAIMLI